MAQSMISYYCFNDNDAALVHDFSVNERHSTAETGFSITTDGGVGKVGVFNGTTTVLNFGNVTAFSSVTGFSIVCRFKTDAIGARQLISFRSENHEFEVTAAGKIKLTVYDSTVTPFSCTSTPSVVASTWYTVVCTWDASNINIYIDSLDSPSTAAASFASLRSNSNSHYLGATSTPNNYFDGNIEMISFYSKDLDDDEINAVIESPNGIKYIAGDGKIQTGDLIYNNNGVKEVCIWSEEFDEMEFSDTEYMLFNDGELIIFKN